MSNQAKIVARVLGEELEKFEADNLCLRQGTIRRMGGQTGHRSEFTEWYDVPYVGTTVDGLNITDFNEVTGLAVPHRVNIYPNRKFTLTNTDTLDTSELSRLMRAAFQSIDNRINRACANAVNIQGSQFVSSTVPLAGFADVANVETRFTEQDVDQLTQKTLLLNARDYNNMAADLQALSRSINNGTISETAYEKAKIAEIANFLTFKTSFTPVKAVAGLASTTATGAQAFVPVGSVIDANGDPTNVDNRRMNFVVATTAGVVAGDKFNVGTLFAVGMQHKETTDELRTFTVLDVVDGTNLTISPPIIPVVAVPTTTEEESQSNWANVTNGTAGGETVTFLNTATAKTNVFWENDAISINVAPVVGSEEDLGGLILMNSTTELGLNVVVAKQGNIGDLSTQWRVTTFFGVTIRDPLKCGVLVGSQP